MSKFNASEFLTEVIAYAQKIATQNKAPLTPERFMIAVIDLIAEKISGDKTEEYYEAEKLINRSFSDVSKAKMSFAEYVLATTEISYIGDMAMKKIIGEIVDANGKDSVITVPMMLEGVLKHSTETIKKAKSGEYFTIIPEGNTEKPIEEKPEQAEKPLEKEAVKEEKSSCSSKEEISELVCEVNELRKKLSGTVYGQDNAINTVVTGYFQSRMLGIIDKARKKPRATFLFAGPPGVGKTFLAETFADVLGLPFMRFDMSEYSHDESVLELCGSDNVYKNSKRGNMTGFIARNPKCVLLFDEIEKAHINIIHLFLQILDAGRIRDSNTDSEIPFSDAIVIFTTNAGRKLYEESESGDLSLISRKVVINSLKNDVNPSTGVPYFPGAICSRFASGNVVMFNHINAGSLRTIVKKEMCRHASSLEKETGIKLTADESVYTALLFSEGASIDARTIKSRTETFFNNELYELLRLVGSEKVDTEITDIENIRLKLDLTNADSEMRALFESGEPVKILVFAENAVVDICKRKLKGFEVLGTSDFAKAVELLKTDNVGLTMLDLTCGAAPEDSDSLNIEDVDSPAREMFKFVREVRGELPLYLLETENSDITEEEKISFVRQGVKGVLRVAESDDTLAENMAVISENLYQQANMKKLASENKLVSFETAQSVSEDGKNAEIRLFDLKLKTAIDSEDGENILSAVSKPNVKFEDVIGAEDAKKELAYFINYLKNPKKYIGTGVKPPKGVLLYGPPGTGKTMLAKAMASESNVTFIAAEGNQFIKKYIGEGPEKVHELFRTARKYAPSILFIDEIDAIGRERVGGENGGRGIEETLTSFLTEMDGFANDVSKPVFVLAATNFDVEPGSPKSLDQALMRRFDRRIYIDIPTKEDRIKFMKMKISKNAAYDISEEQIENIAVRSTGMSLSNLDSAFELALRSVIRDGGTKVTDTVLEEAFETFNNGDVKKWSARELKRTARHEAGHALLCWHSGETPSYLTIVARGNHGGYMQHGDHDGKGTYTKDELLALIRTSLGGRAAEIVYYGENDGISTGASADLAHATSVAESILCSYGMDKDFGMAVIRSVDKFGNMNDNVRKAINKVLDEQMSEAVRILSENKDKLDALVSALLEKDSLKSDEIEEVLGKRG